MKQVSLIDSDGFYLEPVIVDDNQQLDDSLIDVEVPDGFYHPKWDKDSLTWIEGKSQEEIDKITGNTIENKRKEKLDELRLACQDDIINGFDYEVNGILYHFSFDMEAQMNFSGANDFFKEGLITEIEWTVTENGEYKRILLNKEQFDSIKLNAFLEKNNKISRLRNELQPLVENEQSIEILDKIGW